MRLASLFFCAWLAATAIAVVLVGSADAKRRPPRAAVILERQVTGTWVCPEFPGGRIIVSRAVCFIEGWPEPTL